MIDVESMDRLARNIEQHAFRRGYVSAFTLTSYPVKTDMELSLHITRECDGLVYGNAEVGSPEAFRACIEALDGRVDYIVYDVELPFEVVDNAGKYVSGPEKSALLAYRDSDVWIASVRYTLLSLVPDIRNKKGVVVLEKIPDDALGLWLLGQLSGIFGSIVPGLVNEQNEIIQTKFDPFDAFEGADVIIGGVIYKPVITVEQIERTGKKPLLVDACIGTLTPEASEYAVKNGLKMIRVDNRAAMAGTLLSIIQSHDLVTNVMGEGEINGVPVVAGGVVGAPGTVIVDSIHEPGQVIGFADGTGKVRYEPENDEERERLKKVNEAIEGGEVDG